MKLETDFIISGLLIILCTIPFYIYKEQLKRFLIPSQGFDNFVIQLKAFLSTQYPYIPFDFSIIAKLKNEPDTNTKEIQIIENIVTQFCHFTPIKPGIISDSSLLWSTYINNSKPIKDKFPTDFQRRKELLFKLTKQHCQRCGTLTTLNSSYIQFRKPIINGGGYNLENLILCCSDCNIVLSNQDKIERAIKTVTIYEKLAHLAKQNS